MGKLPHQRRHNMSLVAALRPRARLRRQPGGHGLAETFLRRITALLLLIVLAEAALPAVAQDDRVTVRLDGRALFRLGQVNDEPAAERAARAERRLLRLLETPEAIAPAQVEPVEEGLLVSVSGVPIVTVRPSDAEENLTTTEALAAQWAVTINASLDAARGRREGPWGRFTAEVRGSIQTAFARMIESMITLIPRILAAILVLAAFWALAVGIRGIMRLVLARVLTDRTLENLLKQIAYYTIWALGFMLAIDALGIDPQTAATGLGLTGLALGFALKDIISNFVSGILILVLRPFQIGDQIVVGETEGGVERITLRATEMRTYDGRLVLVPNAELFTSRVTNNTAAPVRRASVRLVLGYDADLRRATEVMTSAAQSTVGVLADPPATIRVRELRPDGMLVEARFWADSRRSDFLATESAVGAALVEALQKAEIALPDPNVRVFVPQDAVR